jgi:hypothetical protein
MSAHNPAIESPMTRLKVSGVNEWQQLLHLPVYFLLYVLAFGLSFNTPGYFYGIAKSDPGSYMSHAFTIGLDGDLNYSNEFSTLAGGCINFARTAACHPMGPGIMAAPFVAVLSIIDRANGHPVLTNRLAYLGSWSFFGMQFAAAFYFLVGIALYQKALQRWISPLLVAFTVLSSGLLPYVASSFAMGHSYEFFSIALLTTSCLGLCKARKLWHALGFATLVAIATFLAFMTRWVVYGLLTLPLLAAMTHYLIERSGQYFRAVSLGYIGVTLGCLMVVAFHLLAFQIVWPTPAYFWDEPLGQFIPENASGMFASILGSLSSIPALVLSSEYGLLYTFPLFPLAVAAAIFMWARNFVNGPILWSMWILAFGLCVGVPLATVLLWKTTASAYGYRYLLPAMPALMLSAAVFLNAKKVEAGYGRKAQSSGEVRALVFTLAGCLALISFLAQIGWSKLPGFTVKPQINIFGVQHVFSARGYMDAVFEALLKTSTWKALYDESLFHQITVRSLPMREMPQLALQFGILLLILPLIGAVLSAIAQARDRRQLIACFATFAVALILLLPLTQTIHPHDRSFGTVTFGTRDASGFLGKGFRLEAPGVPSSWITANPATLYGLLPKSQRIEISARLYNPHVDQGVAVLLNGRLVGKWRPPTGVSNQSLDVSVNETESGSSSTVQFVVDQIRPFEGSENAALGVMMYSVAIAPK